MYMIIFVSLIAAIRLIPTGLAKIGAILFALIVMCTSYTDAIMGILLPIAILSPIVYIIKRLTRGKKIEVNANGPYEVTKKKFKMPRVFKGAPLEVEYLNTDGAWIGKNNIVWEVE